MLKYLITVLLLCGGRAQAQHAVIDPATIYLGSAEDTVAKEDTVYWETDQPAVAGYDVKDFLKKHIQYPEHLRKRGETGNVSARVIVNKDGHISNCYVPKGKTPFLREGCRVICSLPPWQPAKVNGEVVRSYAHVTVEFRLQEQKRSVH